MSVIFHENPTLLTPPFSLTAKDKVLLVSRQQQLHSARLGSRQSSQTNLCVCQEHSRDIAADMLGGAFTGLRLLLR